MQVRRWMRTTDVGCAESGVWRLIVLHCTFCLRCHRTAQQHAPPPPSSHSSFLRSLTPIPALEGVYAHLISKVATAAIDGKGWAPRQYLTAVQQLLQSEHGAVAEADLQAALGGDGTAVAALLAMVQQGLLGVRASSGASCVGVLFVDVRYCAHVAVPCDAARSGWLSLFSPIFPNTYTLGS